MNTEKTINEATNPACFLGAVSGCFSSREYNLLRNNKGKQKAFVNGWKSAENGQLTSKCPYEPKVKDFVPTNPYYKAWHSGYESFLNNR